MRTIQQKFEDRMTKLAQDCAPVEIEAVVSRGAANTGTVYFQRENEFTPLVEVGFNFQTGYATFSGSTLPPKFKGAVRPENLDALVEHLRGSLLDAITPDPRFE